MKKPSICLSLMIAVILGSTLTPAPTESIIPLSPAVEPASPVCAPPALEPTSCDAQADDPSGRCFPGQPSCSRNKQCDSYCGTPGWGVCSRFCCYCLG